jgi:sugar lactone lactonase YvrE
MPDLTRGSTFAGHRIEGVAGRGGMGTVYRATHLALDHVVALKVISADLAADDAFRERFRSESRIAVSLRHPNVVSIHHAGEEDGLLFVTMDLIDGPDLRQLLIANGPLPPQRAIAIVAQVASALDVAHSRGLVHRDIKPGNILVETDRGDGSDHAYLTDFGLAKRFDQASSGALTRTGAFVGTLDYVAPEQIRGERVDARTDVYALGCVTHEVISGRAPFADREENVAKIYAHLQDEPPWLPDDSGVAGALDEVIARALAKEPRDRYPSAGDLARAAQAAIEGHEVLRSAERSVATGKAAPETGEPEALPIEETVESDAAVPTAASEPPEGPPEPPAPPATAPMDGPEPGGTATTPAPGPAPTEVTGSVPTGAPGPATAATTATPRPAAAARSGPRWGRLAVAAVAVAAIVVVAVIALGGSGGDEATSSGFAKPKLAGDPIDVEGMPVGIAAAKGTVAVATRSGQRVDLLDEKTGKPSGSVSLPANGEDVAIAAGELWATVPEANAVVSAKLDGGGQQSIDVGAAALGIAAEGNSMVWAAEPDQQRVASIDTGDRSVGTIPIEGSRTPSEVAAGDGVIWVVDRGGGQVFRVDPSDPSAAEGFGVGANPKGVVVSDDGSVWVANTDLGTVVRLNGDGEQQAKVDVGGEPRLLAYGFGRVWVADGDGAVEAIDPADNTFETVKVPGSPEGVAAGAEQVWVTTGTGEQVVRIDPGAAQ